MFPKLPKLPATTLRWIKLMVAFGVSVAIGMAPLLGTADVPGFNALLTLFPRAPFDISTQLIAVTGLLMGIVAVTIQFLQNERATSRRRFTIFARTGIATVLVLVALFITYIFTVEQVGDYAVLIGWNSPACTQCAGLVRSECIAEITTATKDIDRCFGATAVRLSAVALALLYMSSMSLLGALVGMLVLQNKTPPADQNKAEATGPAKKPALRTKPVD